MKTIAMLLIIGLSVAANTCFADADAVKDLVLEGKTLKARFHGELKVLRTGDFYGYGWLDDHRVFIAYQQEGYAEAIVDAEVVDLASGRRSELGTIMEADGESIFDVNSHTRQVVFNGEDAAARGGTLSGIVRLMTFDPSGNGYHAKTLRKNIDCASVSWKDEHTIVATLNDGRDTQVVIQLPDTGAAAGKQGGHAASTETAPGAQAK